MQQHPTPSSLSSARLLTLALTGPLALTSLWGCQSVSDPRVLEAAAAGDYGAARSAIAERVHSDRGPRGSVDRPDRDFALERLRLGIATLADGYTPAVGSALDEVFAILRRESLNADRGLLAAIAGEDRKIWKGEPFEQAMALHYVGLHYAQQGSWDNARTAFGETLFPLAAVVPGERLSNVDVMVRSNGSDETFFDGAVPVESDFALGHLMAGVAAQQMARRYGDTLREEEAAERILHAVRLEPGLADVAARLFTEDYDTLLVVDAGAGPRKIGVGPDGAIPAFEPRVTSDGAPLVVSIGGETTRWPAACDLNRMALDHTWTSLVDLRLAKSRIGDVMVVNGELVAKEGADRGDVDMALAGFGVTTVGLLLKETARADTRHCELMPQRVYVVPLRLGDTETVLSLEVEGQPASRLVLTWPGSDGPEAELRYVKLAGGWGGEAPAWAGSAQVLYANPHAPLAGDRALPYVLGGDCVRPPGAQALADYQRAGRLHGWTVADLEDLYRAEGLVWDEGGLAGQPARHVLEGGRSLVPPHPATAGYARLFTGQHGPYAPRSKRLAALAARLAVTDPLPVHEPLRVAGQ